MRLKDYVISVLFGMLGAFTTPVFADQASDCEISKVAIEEMMNYSFKDFDQSTDSGWRPFYERGCIEVTSMLLTTYVERRPKASIDNPILLLHTGQLLAMKGDYESALAYLYKRLSLKMIITPILDSEAFIRAHIAFLEHDLAGLEASLKKLEAQEPFPNTDDYPAWLRGQKANLDVVQGFIACFNQSFSTAYSQACRNKAKNSNSL